MRYILRYDDLNEGEISAELRDALNLALSSSISEEESEPLDESKSKQWIQDALLINDYNTPKSKLARIDLNDISIKSFKDLLDHPNRPESVFDIEWLRDFLVFEVARHPKTPAKTLDELSRHKDFNFQLAVLKNPGTSNETLLTMLDRPSQEIYKTVIARENLSTEVVDKMAKRVEDINGLTAVTLRNISTHDKLSDEGLSAMVTSKDFNVRTAAAHSNKLSNAQLLILAKDTRVTVRTELAIIERDYPISIWKILATDSAETTREFLATNQKLPTNILIDLTDDSNEYVRKAAKAALAKRDITDDLFDMAEPLEESSLKYVKSFSLDEDMYDEYYDLQENGPAILSDPNATSEELAKIDVNELPSIQSFSLLINHPNCPEIVFDKDKADKYSVSYKIELAKHPKTPASTILLFSKNQYSADLLIEVSKNPNSTESTQINLVDHTARHEVWKNILTTTDPSSKVLMAMALRMSKDYNEPNSIDIMSKDVCKLIGNSKNLSEKAKDALLNSNKFEAREAAVYCKNLSNEDLLRLASDKTDYVRLILAGNDEANYPEVIWKKLLSDKDIGVRISLATNDKTPTDILIELLEDREKSVVKAAKANLAKRDVTDTLFDAADLIEESKLKYIKENVSPENSRSISNELRERIQTTKDPVFLDKATKSNNYWILAAVIENGKLNREQIDRILVNADSNLKSLLSYYCKIEKDQLPKFDECSHCPVALSSNIKSSPDLLIELGKLNRSEIDLQLVNNEKSPSELIEEVARRGNIDVLRSLVEMSRTTWKVLDIIADRFIELIKNGKPNMWILGKLTHHRSVSTDILLKLADIEAANVADYLLTANKSGKAVHLKLAKQESIDVKLECAKHTKFIEVLDELAMSDDPKVIRFLIEHRAKSMSTKSLLILLDSANDEDAKKIKKELSTRDVTDDLFDMSEPLDESDSHEYNMPWKDREKENELDDTNKQIRSRILIAGDQNTPPSILHELVDDATYEVLYALAQNPNTQPEDLRRLGKMEDVGIKENLARNHSTPLDVIEEVSETDDEDILRYVVKRPELNTKIIETVISNCTMIRHADILVSLISRHYSTIPKKNIERLIDIKLSKIDEALAGQSLSDEHYRTLIDRDDVSVLKTIASSHKTSKSILKYLATNGSPLTKIHVVINPSTPTSVLIDLLEDQSVAVKDAAKSVLAKRDISDDLFDIAEPLDESGLKYIRPFN